MRIYSKLILGKTEAAHPGYLGPQDTFYAGTLKGVGRVYPVPGRRMRGIRRKGADLR